ncbi:hypothetical protein ANN_05235 [Periplaneta americana]|uniref:Amine oxidase n=1 Tax=Periplaneta americana TaxID=6978 RepID=A0ABQ8TAI2_PERAM|nr:hypothetical protein ANN_05235 [Periplaneta americana]
MVRARVQEEINKSKTRVTTKPCAPNKVSELAETCIVDPRKPEPCVVIVGAGIAGLSAAHRLVQCGVKTVSVLEATDRLGGRIHSCWIGDVVAEMGAQYIEGGCIANSIFTLASQEGLLKSPLQRQDLSRGLFCTSDGRALDSSLSITACHIFQQIERQATALFSTEGCGNDHGSLQNFMTIRIQQELLKFPEVERYDAARIMYGMSNCVRCRCGDDLSLISADNFGSFVEIPGGNIRVPLGFVGVLAPLLRDLPDDIIHYKKPVENIQWDLLNSKSPRVIVKCCDGEEFPADYVIVTVSLGVLKAQAEKLFCPTLTYEKKTAINKLGYGKVSKIFLQYERPFWVWKEGNIKLAWSPEELEDRTEWAKGLCMFEEMVGSQHVLCAWVAGQEAEFMENCSDEEIASSMTRILRRFTGDPSLPYPNNVLRSKWCTDPYFRGAYSYMGIESSVRHQRDLEAPFPSPSESNIPKLFFAGEATSPTHYSTVHGARFTGIREAERILDLTRRLRGPPKSGS